MAKTCGICGENLLEDDRCPEHNILQDDEIIEKAAKKKVEKKAEPVAKAAPKKK